MKTRLVPIGSLSSADEEAWRDLVGRAIEPNPFFEPDFLLLSARCFEGYAKTTLVIAEEGDEFKGVLPIIGVDRPRIPPRAVATTMGRPTSVIGLCTPLVDRRCVDDVVGSLLSALHDATRRDRWPGIFLFAGIDNDGPVVASLRRICAARGLPVHTREIWNRGFVTRGGKWENPLSKERKRQIERKRRALTRDTGFEVNVVDETLEPSAADDFLALEAAGWKGKDGGSAFAQSADTAAWFREWYAHWVAMGRVSMFSVKAGDVTIATQCYVRAGDGLFCFRTAYDENYSKYGPGAMMLALGNEHMLHHSDAQWIDSSTDKNNGFMLEMLPERRNLSILLVGTGGMLDRRLVAALPAMSKVVAWQRQARTWPARRRSKTTEAPETSA